MIFWNTECECRCADHLWNSECECEDVKIIFWNTECECVCEDHLWNSEFECGCEDHFLKYWMWMCMWISSLK